MGLSEKSGSPFYILKNVERIAKNRVVGAKNKNSSEFRVRWNDKKVESSCKNAIIPVGVYGSNKEKTVNGL